MNAKTRTLPGQFDLAQKPVGHVGQVGHPVSMRVCASPAPKTCGGTSGTNPGFDDICPPVSHHVPRHQKARKPAPLLVVPLVPHIPPDLKQGLEKKDEKPASQTAGDAPVNAAGEPRAPAPLTPAERQRRHRAKVKAAAAAHAMTAAGRLLPENQRLVRQVEFMAQEIAQMKAKAQKSAAQLQQLQQETRAGHERLQALRASLRDTLPRLPLVTATVLRRALKEAGFIAWLDSG